MVGWRGDGGGRGGDGGGGGGGVTPNGELSTILLRENIVRTKSGNELRRNYVFGVHHRS